jgi:hypothetical protein
MREIPLTQGKVAIVDDDLYPRLSQVHWCALHVGRNRWYAASSMGGTRANQYMHRVVVPGAEKQFVHHINGNPLDNRRENLAVVSPGEHSRIHNLGNHHAVKPTSARIDREGEWWRRRRELKEQRRLEVLIEQTRMVAGRAILRFAQVLLARRVAETTQGTCPELYNLCEAAARLGLSRQRILQVAKHKSIGSYQDRHWHFNPADLATIQALRGARPIRVPASLAAQTSPRRYSRESGCRISLSRRAVA